MVLTTGTSGLKIPVPYKTMSAFADFQALKNQNLTNWMGLGLAFFNDVAGDGELKLTKIQGSLAYHVEMGERNMIFKLGYLVHMHSEA